MSRGGFTAFDGREGRFCPPVPSRSGENGVMMRDEFSRFLASAHRERFAVTLRAINESGNTVDIVGYVTEIRRDGGIRLCEGDPVSGQVHDVPARRILRVDRVHGA